ncbi:NERD domain-containing protein [Algoriphagus formosus]|uniref:nuclease-related domain-containing protein n=1 Tax=Algoriphagus formosus TaxID=2007308 RepID=UPI003F6F55CF
MLNHLLLILACIIVFVFWVYLSRVFIPRVKGDLGEFWIAKRLNRLNKKDYIVLNDVLLRMGKASTQIDHIVIAKSGLFVLETKNYKGWIHGHENSTYWKQTIFKKQFKFQNPIIQNKSHVYYLKQALRDIPRIDYYPVVVFSERAVLKNVTTWSPVIYSSELIQTIKNMNSEPKLTDEQMRKISVRLNGLRMQGGRDRKEHIRRIRNKNRIETKNSDSRICPRCGSQLRIRKGRLGEFFGCSSYPACTYTENIRF